MNQRSQIRGLLRALFIGAVALGMGTPAAWAQASAEATISPEEILIGEQPTYTLTITAEAETIIDTIDLAVLQNVEGLEVLQERKSRRRGEGGSQLLEYRLTLTAFDADLYKIPAIPVRYRYRGESGVAFSNELELTVNTLPEETDSLRLMPIKDIVEEPLNFWDLLPYILVFLIAGIIIGLIMYWMSRGKEKTVPEKPPRRIPLQAYTEQQLQSLDQQQLWQKGEIKAYHNQLTHILREYLGYRFSIPALEKTTTEIYEALRGQAISQDTATQLYQMLQTVDLVKFAKAEPPASFHEEALENVRGFVQQTSDPSLMLAIYESGKVEVYRKENEEDAKSSTTT